MEEWQERTGLLLGPDGLRKLSFSRVLVVGTGGVGACAAEMLARAGVGHLTIVDADTVSATNINRQLPALHSTVGKPKVEVLSARLLDTLDDESPRALVGDRDETKDGMPQNVYAAGNSHHIVARATELQSPEVAQRYQEVCHASLPRHITRAERTIRGILAQSFAIVEKRRLIRNRHGVKDAQHLILNL